MPHSAQHDRTGTDDARVVRFPEPRTNSPRRLLLCRLSIETDGRWIDLQNDLREEGGFSLSVKTDGATVRVDVALDGGGEPRANGRKRPGA